MSPSAGLAGPQEIIFNGNYLFVAEYVGKELSIIDVTATTASAAAIASGLDSPSGLLFDGDNLYISEYAGNRISIMDISVTSPTPTL